MKPERLSGLPVRRRLGLFSGLLLFLAAVSGCASNTPSPPPSPAPPTAAPAALPTPTTVPSPTATPDPDTGWLTLRPGLERRIVRLDRGPVTERLYLLRLDPAAYRFDVAYQPGQPRSLAEWRAETGALLVVNGGFFTEDYQATGLVIVDGQRSGTSYRDFGGMLAIGDTGPSLRWLPQEPYDPAEPLRAGLQSFPMLIRPGRIGYEGEDVLPARRTVIAQDRDGRILFLVAMTGSFTLPALSQYLLAADFDVERALNLDGGASSGLRLALPDAGVFGGALVDEVPAFSLLPTVITVSELE